MTIKNFFLLSAKFKLKKIVKFVFHKSPNLLFFLKKNFYFTLPGVLDKKQFYYTRHLKTLQEKIFSFFHLMEKLLLLLLDPLMIIGVLGG